MAGIINIESWNAALNNSLSFRGKPLNSFELLINQNIILSVFSTLFVLLLSINTFIDTFIYVFLVSTQDISKQPPKQSLSQLHKMFKSIKTSFHSYQMFDLEV